jgi:hypothetical protein
MQVKNLIPGKQISLSQKILWWANFMLVLLAGIPMVIAPLKEHLPEHAYGIMASLGPLLTFVILTWQNHVKTNPPPWHDPTQDAGA